MANTINDKLTYLSGTKDAIKQAIIAKGIEISDTDTFRSYADKITSIQSGGGGTVNIPDGTKYGYSTFTTVPSEILPYLEQQTDMSFMFGYCTSLTSVPLFDTTNVSNMSYMFYNCGSLTSVPLFDTANVTIMNMMFHNCTSLQTVPQFDTSNVTTMYNMFAGCEELQTVPLFNTANATDMDFMFTYCPSLTNLGGFTGLKVNLDLSESPLLTVESVMNVITAAADMTSDPKTLTLHEDVFNKLSSEQIATASAKGWNVAAA